MKSALIPIILCSLFSVADDVSLCGDDNQKVCLTNSATFRLTGTVTLYNGTLIVLGVPDLNLENPPFVAGSPSVPYRIEPAGTVTDNMGNTWSTAQIIESDSRGPIAIRFQLLSGSLPPNSTVNLQDIRVCQYVADGPGPVVLRVSVWGVLNKAKTAEVTLVEQFHKDGESFISCSQGTNSAPIPRSVSHTVSRFLDPVSFSLQALDPETALDKLSYQITQLPTFGNVTVTSDGYVYQATEEFEGLDELKFTVSDGVNAVEGRIGFYMDQTDAALAFSEPDGLVLVGEKLNPTQLDVMTLSDRPADVRIALDDAYVNEVINPNLMKEGIHIVRAELVDRETLEVITTAYRYVFRRIESAETFLEVTELGSGAGFLLAGAYGDLEVHAFDNADTYAFALDGEQYAKLSIAGIQDGTMKLYTPPLLEEPWLFEKPLAVSQELEIRPGFSYFVQVETAQQEDATYSLDLRRKFPNTFVPLLEPEDRCMVHNANSQSVILKWTEWPSGYSDAMIVPAFSQIELNQKFNDAGTSAVEITSSLPITTAVITRAHGDLDIISQGPSYFSSCILPHLASQTTTWRNRFTFATQSSTDLFWSFGNGSSAQGHVDSPGSFAYEFPSYVPTPKKSWTKLDVSGPNSPHINGFLSFSKRSGAPGSASVAPMNTDLFEPGHTSQSYFLAHVAQDQGLFWTGYSLLNPDPNRIATIYMKGYDAQGNQISHEAATIPAGGQEIGVIGVDRLAQSELPVWVRIDSSRPLVGIELFGGVNVEQSYLAGFGLPTVPKSQLSFPFVDAVDGSWTGIALVNVGSEIADVEIRYRNNDGSIAKTTNLRMAANTKSTVLAPTGFSGTAICRERLDRATLVGFALVGDEGRTELGGYTGH